MKQKMIIIFFMLFVCSPSYALGFFGSIVGIVTDTSSGCRIAGARIEIDNGESVYTSYSSDGWSEGGEFYPGLLGIYRQSLDQGSYTLTVEAYGYETYSCSIEIESMGSNVKIITMSPANNRDSEPAIYRPYTIYYIDDDRYSVPFTDDERDDTIPPEPPVIIEPVDGYSSEDYLVTLKGTCLEDTDTIEVNGSDKDKGVSYTAGETSWTYSGTLIVGENLFNVTAKDAAGNESSEASIAVIYNPPSETEPPESDVTAVIYKEGELSVDWTASDELSGVASTELWYKREADDFWHNTDISAQFGISGTFTYYPEDGDGDGIYYFATRSTDNAGNIEAKPAGNGDIHMTLPALDFPDEYCKIYYKDADGDGFGYLEDQIRACNAEAPDGYVKDATDCDDNDWAERPGQDWYRDRDGDKFSDGMRRTSCERPEGYYLRFELKNTTEDCDDNDPSINPDAVEVCYNGIDDNCDGEDDNCDGNGAILTGIFYPPHADNTPPSLSLIGIPNKDSGETDFNGGDIGDGYMCDASFDSAGTPVITISDSEGIITEINATYDGMVGCDADRHDNPVESSSESLFRAKDIKDWALGGIVGYVHDETYNVINDRRIRITLKNERGNDVWVYYNDFIGIYYVPWLDQGTYTLTVETLGYNPVSVAVSVTKRTEREDIIMPLLQ